MMVVDYRIGGPDQIGEGVHPGSNLVRRFTDEWPRVDPVWRRCSSGGRLGSQWGAMAAHRRWGARRLRFSIPTGFLPTASE
jgi:hypothetical protein